MAESNSTNSNLPLQTPPPDQHSLSEKSKKTQEKASISLFLPANYSQLMLQPGLYMLNSTD